MKIKFSDAQTNFDAAINHLKSELSAIRAGRANTQLLENVKAEAYGQMMPINQLGNINVADPTLLTVHPWDKSIINNVQKAIAQAGLGLNPSVDGDIIRVPVPALTEERRVEYVKLMKNKLEETRIAIRQVRKEIILSLEEEKEQKLLTEDDFKAREKQLQEIVDKANDQVEALGKEKEAELMTV